MYCSDLYLSQINKTISSLESLKKKKIQLRHCCINTRQRNQVLHVLSRLCSCFKCSFDGHKGFLFISKFTVSTTVSQSDTVLCCTTQLPSHCPPNQTWKRQAHQLVQVIGLLHPPDVSFTVTRQTLLTQSIQLFRKICQRHEQRGEQSLVSNLMQSLFLCHTVDNRNHSTTSKFSCDCNSLFIVWSM